MSSSKVFQPTVFLMMGIPGAGKSFFAKRLSDEYNLPIVSSDSLRVEMFNQPSYTSGEQAVVNRVSKLLIDELFKTKRSFVIDGLFANVRSNRLNLHKIAKNSGYNLLIVWVQANREISKERSLKRSAHKIDDAYNAPMNEVSFEALEKMLTAPGKFEKYVVISGKHTFNTQKSAVMKKLPRPRRPENSLKAMPRNRQDEDRDYFPNTYQQQNLKQDSSTPGDMRKTSRSSGFSSFRSTNSSRPATRRDIPITED